MCAMWDALDEELLPIPDGLVCPVCQSFFDDPVATVDGHSYCRACITEWFVRHDRRAAERKRTCQHLDARGEEVPFPLLAPMTQLALPSRALQSNVALRRAVAAYKEGRPSWEQRERERLELRERFDELENRHEFILDADHKTALLAELYRTRQRVQDLEGQLRSANSEVKRLRELAGDFEAKLNSEMGRRAELSRREAVLNSELAQVLHTAAQREQEYKSELERLREDPDRASLKAEIARLRAARERRDATQNSHVLELRNEVERMGNELARAAQRVRELEVAVERAQDWALSEVREARAKGQSCEIAPPDAGEHDAGASPPLHMAAVSGRHEVVRLLCKSGCDKDQADRTGATPLHLAACNGYVEVVRALCQCGADGNRSDATGTTPLHIAAIRGHLEVVRLLCELGMELERPDCKGVTALHIASHMGHIDIVRCLLEAGAEAGHAAHSGSTPLDAASRQGHKDVARLLREAAAWPLRAAPRAVRRMAS